MKNIFLLLCLISLKAQFAFSFNEINELKIHSFKDLNPVYFEWHSFEPSRKVLDSDLNEASAFFNESKDLSYALEEMLQKRNQDYISSLGFQGLSQ